MRNRRIGIILGIFVIILLTVAILVPSCPSGNDDNSIDEPEKTHSGGIFHRNDKEPEPTEPPEPTPTFTTAPEGYFDDALIIGDSRTVDVHIKRLREKLEGVSDQWSLKTVWGVGYKFEVAK